MFIERIGNWGTRIISQEVNRAQSQGVLPKAIARAERFGIVNITCGRAEAIIYLSLIFLIDPNTLFIAAPTSGTHVLLDIFNGVRIKHLKSALDKQLGGSAGSILSH